VAADERRDENLILGRELRQRRGVECALDGNARLPKPDPFDGQRLPIR
jgi:hypothetical protein